MVTWQPPQLVDGGFDFFGFIGESQSKTEVFQILDLPFIPGMNGPRASIRVFLCDLRSLATDTKVRFLGWYVRGTYMYGIHLTSKH